MKNQPSYRSYNAIGGHATVMPSFVVSFIMLFVLICVAMSGTPENRRKVDYGSAFIATLSVSAIASPFIIGALSDD